MYDITNYKSLNNVYNWKSEVEKATSINPFTHIPTVLVGNKVPHDCVVKKYNIQEILDFWYCQSCLCGC